MGGGELLGFQRSPGESQNAWEGLLGDLYGGEDWKASN